MRAQETIDLIKEHLETGRAIEFALVSGNWRKIRRECAFPDLPRECFRIAPEEPVKEFRMPEGGFWVRRITCRTIHYWPYWIGVNTVCIGHSHCIDNGRNGEIICLQKLQESFQYSHTRRDDDWHSF